MLSVRVADGETGEFIDDPIEAGTKMVVDLYTAQHGGVEFTPFRRVLKTYDVANVEMPEDMLDQKYCICILVFIDGQRLMYEWMATGAFTTRAIDALLSDALGAAEARQGKVPVVEYCGSLETRPQSGPIKGKTFYTPRLNTLYWIDRPEFFGQSFFAAPPQHPAISQSAPRLTVASDTPQRPLKAGDIGRAIGDSIPF